MHLALALVSSILSLSHVRLPAWYTCLVYIQYLAGMDMIDISEAVPLLLYLCTFLVPLLVSRTNPANPH